MKTKDQCLSEIYNYLCKCQDLAEESGDLILMSQFEDMRTLINAKRFRKNV